MPISDWLMITAVLLAPVIAVQVQKWLERKREAQNRKTGIFFTLMANRATPISSEYVQALNMIDVAFYRDRDVREAWSILLDHLNKKNDSNDNAIANAWVDQANGFRLKLLQEMAKVCGYEFNAVNLKNGNYYPQGHGKFEEEVTALRQGVIALLSGEKALPVTIQDKHADQNVMK